MTSVFISVILNDRCDVFLMFITFFWSQNKDNDLMNTCMQIMYIYIFSSKRFAVNS